MPISSNLGYSAVARPGVCTSSTRPAAPFQGQVIYETDTGRTLVWNSTAWVFLSTGSAGDLGLVKIVPTSAINGTISADGTVTIGNSQTSVGLNGVFSAAFDCYKIMVSGTGTSASGAGYLSLQLGSTTSGWATSNYRYDYISANLAGATPTSVGSVNANSFPYVGFKGATAVMAAIEVINPFLATSTMVFAPAGQVGNNMGPFTGVQIDSTSFTNFLLLSSNGTGISGGSIRVYGYRN